MISPQECTKMSEKEIDEFATAEKQIDKELSERYLPDGRVVVVFLCVSARVQERLVEAYGKRGWKVRPGPAQHEKTWLAFTVSGCDR